MVCDFFGIFGWCRSRRFFRISERVRVPFGWVVLLGKARSRSGAVICLKVFYVVWIYIEPIIIWLFGDPVKFRMSSLLGVSRAVESTDSIELIWRWFFCGRWSESIKTSVFYTEVFRIIEDRLFIYSFFMSDLCVLEIIVSLCVSFCEQ